MNAILVFQNEDISVQLDELDEMDSQSDTSTEDIAL